MRTSRLALLAATLGTVLACSSSTSPNGLARRGEWASGQADLMIADQSAHLAILADVGCIASYGDIPQSIPSGSFDLSGTYTQVTNIFPGTVQYPAQFSGTAQADQLSISVTVPALQQTFGPFTLAYGVHESWSVCAFP